MLPKLPLSIQSFRKLRDGGYLYVDKTELICQMAEPGGCYFLSRPRRFGKSLLTSTLKELYSGDKGLFKNLWAEENWDWNRTNPVVHISFSSIGVNTLGLELAIYREMDTIAESHGIVLKSDRYDTKFKELIKEISVKSDRVVILIDEYDKPIIDHLDNLPKAKENRAILKSFYSILKDSDPYLELVFITGVSKFSKVSIFSDLNNLTDITLQPEFGTICGYTQVELERDFEAHISKLGDGLGLDKVGCLDMLRVWYNGYNFRGTERVYNPWSILSCFKSGLFENYWFVSGTPTFLIKMLKDQFVSDLDNVEVSALALNSYDLENIDILPLLLQTGYLTIKSQDREQFILTYPNREVKAAMLQHLIGAFRHNTTGNSVNLAYQLEKAFQEKDIPKVIEVINTTFSTIPYQHFDANREGYYHSLIHLLFTLTGVDVRSEVHNSKGRLDVVVHTDTSIFIFEFKLDKSAELALQQILDNGYADPYRLSGKELVLVGINFDGKTKEVGEWIVSA